MDDLLALGARRQVDVDVRPLPALFREEAFEEQLHADRIDGRDAQRITDGTVCGRAATLAEDPVACREGDDVLDDQEVAREVELLDDLELVMDLPRDTGVGTISVAFADTDSSQLAKAAHLGLAGAQGVSGKAIVELFERELAAFRDDASLADPFGVIGEALHDLFAGLQMSLAIGREESPGTREGLALPKADQRIEESAIPGHRTTHVARRHDRDALGPGHLGRSTPHPGDATVEPMRDVDCESLPEDVPGLTEEGGPKLLVASEEHAPFAREGLELAPFDPDPISRTRVPGLERLAPSAVRQAQESTKTPPALGRLHEQQQPVGRSPVDSGRPGRPDGQPRPGGGV